MLLFLNDELLKLKLIHSIHEIMLLVLINNIKLKFNVLLQVVKNYNMLHNLLLIKQN